MNYNSTIDVYGAGKRAGVCIPVLKKYFRINAIFDSSKEKVGSIYHGKSILSPSDPMMGDNPIVVTVFDISSVMQTLRNHGLTKNIYWCASNSSRDLIIVEVEYDDSLLLKYDKIFKLSVNQEDPLLIKEDSLEFQEGKPRIFNIASPSDFDGPGGPVACLRNMWLANLEYRMIDNLYTACPAVVYVPKNGDGISNIEEAGIRTISIAKGLSEVMRKHSNSNDHLTFFLNICRLAAFLEDLDRRFRFTNDDVFLLQDTFILLAFMYQFPDLKRIATAYHGQGTMSSELKKSNPHILDAIDDAQLLQLSKVKHWIFPSKGASEGFLHTATPAMREAAKSCEFHVAYNGYEKKELLSPDNDFVAFLDSVKADAIFASASFLYRNKGVERIPKILAKFKSSTGIKIHWILVGGGEMEKEVEAAIEDNLEESDYTWFRERFANQDNIFALFSKADFYIMMHRVSVFDLSTLQAMSYECVPFLSDVGGNKELCGFDNGLLCNPEESDLRLNRFMKDNRWDKTLLEICKNNNATIIVDNFNNRKFLSGYYDVLRDL